MALNSTPLLDLHAHYPMHTRFPPQAASGPNDAAKVLEFWAATHLLDYQSGEPRVSRERFLAGSPGGIGSVLLDPDDEFFRGPEPRPEAFDHLRSQHANVEGEAGLDDRIRIARNPSQVEESLRTGQKFLFHCVEGGFALGGNEANVPVLASMGIAYVVVAHLFFRGVATCVNAIPNLPDAAFPLLNPDQPAHVGLTEIGKKIVEALFRAGILVDITHSSEKSIEDIFEIASGFPGQPVISSHTGVRATSNYLLNLSDQTIRRIAASGGVIGVILFPYYLRQPDQQLFGREDIGLVFDAIDYIHQVTGSYDHIAIGSDLDGFIRPIQECPNYSETPRLVDAIAGKYGANAPKLLWQNALDTLLRGWRGV